MKNNQMPSFPPVYYGRKHVMQLLPEETDELLSNGWFRYDLNVVATTARPVEGELRPVLMLRIPLQNYTFRRRLAKLMRHNQRHFEVEIQPFFPSAEKDNLWIHFKEVVHGWKNTMPLQMHLFREQHPERFNTYEVCVRHQGRLIGISLFDQGNHSIAALEAAYDPEYRKFSLGIYTMLLEIQYGIRQGLEWYYPGFIPKDVPMFEYKLRPGRAEFFRLREKRWVPWEQLSEKDWLYNEVIEKLKLLEARLNPDLFQCNLMNFNFLTQKYTVEELTSYNVWLQVNCKNHFLIKVVWDVLNECYRLFKLEEASKIDNPFAWLFHAYSKVKALSTCKSIEETVACIERIKK